MVYAYANIIVTNPERLAAYRERAAVALAKHGGRVLHASPQQTVLEGDGPDLGIGVILAFETAQSARDWIEDTSLKEVHALRNDAGHSTITLLA